MKEQGPNAGKGNREKDKEGEQEQRLEARGSLDARLEMLGVARGVLERAEVHPIGAKYPTICK